MVNKFWLTKAINFGLRKMSILEEREREKVLKIKIWSKRNKTKLSCLCCFHTNEVKIRQFIISIRNRCLLKFSTYFWVIINLSITKVLKELLRQ